jgi:hypothetical protein
MNSHHQFTSDTRRDFLTTSASGIGGVALHHMLSEELAANSPKQNILDPRPHFAPRAKNCIFIFMAGAPSQLDLFDYKPKLNELNGQKMNAELLKGKRFAFLQKESAVLMGSPRKFKQHGKSGMWFSDLLPRTATCADDICMVRSMHTDQFNHHPGQLQMQCGEARFGLPSTGSWLNYGLGTENQNLPGYIVLTAGRGSSGGATLWQSGFLPSNYAGVRFRNGSSPLLNLENPKGLPNELQRAGLDTLQSLNKTHHKTNKDPETLSRIASYELAFRMQSAAPELVDLSKEKITTLDSYGVSRAVPKGGGRGKGNGNAYADFSRNCLLARRMVERGVRFINIIHASWDHHSNLNQELEFNAGMSDQPVATLINDLKERGLLDETLVVWAGEFGRTPLGENRRGRAANTGRDHHPNAFTLLMAGGGVKGGLTYGSTDDIGWAPEENPVHVNDFQATLLHLFGLDHERLTHPNAGIERRLTSITRQSRVVHELFT